jgi:hypothetical protein
MPNSADNQDPNRSSGASDPSFQRDAEPASKKQIQTVGIALLLLALLMGYLFLSLWPADVTQATLGSKVRESCLLASDRCFKVTVDVTLMMIVMLAGGLGSLIHVAISFCDFVGNKKFIKSWFWWYIMKPFIAMILALVFYLVIRGQFLSAGAPAGQINLYGIVSISGMTGLFSKQAINKLSEVFDALFRTAPDGGDAQRMDSLNESMPLLSSLTPSGLRLMASQLDLHASGSNFTKGSVLRIDGANRKTVFINDTALKATLLPEDVAKERSLTVDVFNPPPGAGASNSMTLKVASA